MELISQFAAVAAVLALTGGATWLLRRGGSVGLRRARRAGIVEAIDKVVLTPQMSIHLVRIRGSEVVLAVHSTGVTVLDVSSEVHRGAMKAGAG